MKNSNKNLLFFGPKMTQQVEQLSHMLLDGMRGRGRGSGLRRSKQHRTSAVDEQASTQ
jgi:hypothetical protein